MNRQQKDSPKGEQEKAEEQQTQPPSTLINQPIQSKPSNSAPIVKNGHNQRRSQETAERKQGPPAWLLPVLIISFVAIVITAAILSLIKQDAYMMLVALVMTFILVHSVVRYYFPSNEGLLPQLLIFILKLFNRQT
jgi:Flp pilus assembly protein TadB